MFKESSSQLFFRLALLAGLLGLTACDQLEEYVSSGGEQDLTRFTPGVAQPETSAPSASDGGADDSSSSSSSVPLPSTSPNTPTEPTDTSSSDNSDSTDDSPDTSTSSDASDINAPSLATTGIVWKPVSEGDHKLVILTPTSYGTPSITILDSSGRVVENGRYVGHTNGNRATYRFSRPGSGYSSPAYLRVNSTLYLVSNTSSRYN